MPAKADVTTIAGAGIAGYKDGPAATATFEMPTALAYAANGDVYIADQGAQRIRVLREGRIITIAGSGDDIAPNGQVIGGYADGAALHARFHDPSGIAVDGRAVYVADRQNHCIRRIEDGRVTTYAGSNDRIGSSDGGAPRASFTEPTALAIDSAGDLFVADYGVGIRKITQSGVVSTLNLGPTHPAHFVALSLTGTAGTSALFATQSDGNPIRYRIASAQTDLLTPGASSNEETHPWGVAAIDDTRFVATDIQTNVIDVYGAGSSDNGGVAIAGVALSPGADGAGYLDGPAPMAKFYLPSAIVLHDGVLTIAEAGDRRLRQMPLPDVRFPSDNITSIPDSNAEHYRILFAAGASAFWQTAWSDSIAGMLESQLTADRERIGLRASPLVDALRLDSNGVANSSESVASSARVAHAGLAVVLIDEGTFTPDAVPILARLEQTLSQRGTSLVVAGSLPGPCLGSAEWFVATQEASDTPVCADSENIATMLRAAGVTYYSMDADLQSYEASDRRLPVYAAEESANPTSAGYAIIAKLLVSEIERRRPWANP